MFNFLQYELASKKEFHCLQCGHGTDYVTARSGCPACGHHLFKVADRGTGSPEAFQTQEDDPYNPKRKQRGQTTVGDQDQSGLGTNDRGNAAGGVGVSGFSVVEDRVENRDTDVPISDHKFMDGFSPDGEGFANSDYADPVDSLSRSNWTFNSLKNQQGEPIGPHNMQQNRSVWDKVYQRQKGF